MYSFMELDPMYVHMGFPGGSDGKESTLNARDPGLIPESEDSLEKGCLPGEFHGQRSLAGHSP